MANVAIIDDNLTSLAQMRRILEAGGFTAVRTYDNPATALSDFADSMPDVVVSDYLMPQLDGIHLTRQIRTHRHGSRVAVALVTGLQSRSFLRDALEAGVVDVIAKPIEPVEFAQRVRNLARLAGAEDAASGAPADFKPFTPLSPPQRQAWTAASHDAGALRCLELVASMRDDPTGYHTTRMAHYAAAIGRGMGLPAGQCELLLAAAPLHDIGKVGTPDTILRKPGLLSPAERAQMERHTVIGHRILKTQPSEVFQAAAEIALTHHEHFDGSGYPQGLSGNAIPLFGRIVALADVFDALTTIRPYKPAWLIERAVGVIQADAGRHFDPAVVQAFMAVLEEIRTIKRHYDAEEAYVAHGDWDIETQPVIGH